MNIQEFIRNHQQRVESALKTQFANCVVSAPFLHEVMEYGVFNGGKRIRPVLAYAGARALGSEPHCADIAACALECVHSYSLIHDDLPAMDDDDLRRGKPTCHKAFDEASAILAGDALQTLAFELLADSDLLRVSDRNRIRMISVLGRAIGASGMVGGQSLDFIAAGTQLDEAGLEQMHSLKTGALINASVLLGALSTDAASAEDLASLHEYARHIGLAFQVKDDILDVQSDTQTLGKQQGRDQVLNKPTYTSMLGIEGAIAKAEELYRRALAALEPFGDRADALAGLADFIVHRRY
ncbi:MAG: (2E,6E)-farnesyl diphosphate synthase [Pseudomonadales bacterium]|nr:(2E,6E)-farnesyl diphosphate synthase [Pseudomonadales bacterium]